MSRHPNEKCNTTFVWRTRYACKQCIPAEQYEEKGPCIGGKQQRIYKYKVPCYEEEVPPEFIECYDIEVESTSLTFGVIGSVVLIMAGVGSAIYFFLGKRKLEVKYELLSTQVKDDENEL